jgi:hypothetical protein
MEAVQKARVENDKLEEEDMIGKLMPAFTTAASIATHLVSSRVLNKIPERIGDLMVSEGPVGNAVLQTRRAGGQLRAVGNHVFKAAATANAPAKKMNWHLVAAGDHLLDAAWRIYDALLYIPPIVSDNRNPLASRLGIDHDVSLRN